MTKVIADITMSLDGYVTGAGADPAHGLGDAEDLHDWVMDQSPVDTAILEEATAGAGAVVMGRNLFDVVDGPDGWTTEMGFGAEQAGTPPYFVVTHLAPDGSRLEREVGLQFTFVTDGVRAAVEQARSAAGDRDVVVMGGGDVVGQVLEAGLADELHLHISPMILGSGTPLFRPGTRQRYHQREVRPSEHAIHVTYERRDDAAT